MGKNSGANYAIVMMDTAAPELYCLSIDPQAMGRIQLQLPYTKAAAFLIQHVFPFHYADTVAVEIRRIHIPEGRVFYIKLLAVCIFCVLLHSYRHGILRGNISLPVQQLHKHVNRSCPAARIFQHRFRAHHRQAFLQIHTGQMDAVRRKMETVCNHQLHIPVNAAARIPTSARHAVFHNYLNLILLSEFNISCGINIKITIAVRALPRIGIIDVNKSILINAFKLQPDIFILILFLQDKFLCVITVLLHKKPVSAAVFLLAVAGLSHRGIMGKRHRLSRILSAAHQGLQGASAAFVVHPVSIKTDFLHFLFLLPFIVHAAYCMLPFWAALPALGRQHRQPCLNCNAAFPFRYFPCFFFLCVRVY